MHRELKRLMLATSFAAALSSNQVLAQDDCDAACQAARNAQDPLAPVTALFSDNTIGYGPNDEDTMTG